MLIFKPANLYFFCLLVSSFECSITANAQKHKLDHYSIAVTTLHTNLPFGSFSSLFTSDIHPGIEAAADIKWKEKPRHEWYQEFLSGYTYHRWVQHSISLYTAAGYRYKFPRGFYAEGAIGAGYLQAIPDSKVFKLQNNGTYKKKINFGRPQFLAVFDMGIGKIFTSGKTIFLKYQQRLQTPFIKSYVPVLPANMMQLGIAFPFRNNKH